MNQPFNVNFLKFDAWKKFQTYSPNGGLAVIYPMAESKKKHLKQTQEFGALKNPIVFDIETHEFPPAGSFLGGETEKPPNFESLRGHEMRSTQTMRTFFSAIKVLKMTLHVGIKFALSLKFCMIPQNYH